MGGGIAAPLVSVSYLLAAFLFITGLKRMSSPVTARGGIVWAGAGMVVATIATFFTPDLSNFVLILLAVALGGGVAWITGKRVAMTDMPQMIALYNGMAVVRPQLSPPWSCSRVRRTPASSWRWPSSADLSARCPSPAV